MREISMSAHKVERADRNAAHWHWIFDSSK
ncbi:hypothetical protein JOM49_005801 [Amycolatopsis magusensis]|uniref:Uncharacterized protein n=1 Tax=Amycolatopsis magusensis TaxID=882444 RepID=A0ABS4PXX0_9PSEU|nr:hypothetical protein [Amycolatopsis magusensis]